MFIVWFRELSTDLNITILILLRGFWTKIGVRILSKEIRRQYVKE